MFRLRLVRTATKIPFLRFRKACLAASILLGLGSLFLFFVPGLNYGIDFKGGIVMEVRSQAAEADLGAMRSTLSHLEMGDVSLQNFGGPRDVLIRIEAQKGAEDAQQKAVERVRTALGAAFEYRRVEYVGPHVTEELIRGGIIAVLVACLAMMIYVWFRFEWQFGVGSIAALAHDVLMTVGVLTLTRTDVNLPTIAAILTIIGYSMNDTVVVYDRIRENLRKYKRMPIDQLLDLSINETLSRTTMTSATTLLALLPLWLFGGEAVA
ncbi:MAG: protein translocase subunit SecF, partial [Alphaproteobacteria bacterium]|nr:protein translocase subunit SecF [Alphaproteobacteria bacterium]